MYLHRLHQLPQYLPQPPTLTPIKIDIEQFVIADCMDPIDMSLQCTFHNDFTFSIKPSRFEAVATIEVVSFYFQSKGMDLLMLVYGWYFRFAVWLERITERETSRRAQLDMASFREACLYRKHKHKLPTTPPALWNGLVETLHEGMALKVVHSVLLEATPAQLDAAFSGPVNLVELLAKETSVITVLHGQEEVDSPDLPRKSLGFVLSEQEENGNIIVTELLRDHASVSVGMTLVGINGFAVESQAFDDVLSALQVATKPVRLEFAPIDTPYFKFHLLPRRMDVYFREPSQAHTRTSHTRTPALSIQQFLFGLELEDHCTRFVYSMVHLASIKNIMSTSDFQGVFESWDDKYVISNKCASMDVDLHSHGSKDTLAFLTEMSRLVDIVFAVDTPVIEPYPLFYPFVVSLCVKQTLRVRLEGGEVRVHHLDLVPLSNTMLQLSQACLIELEINTHVFSFDLSTLSINDFQVFEVGLDKVRLELPIEALLALQDFVEVNSPVLTSTFDIPASEIVGLPNKHSRLVVYHWASSYLDTPLDQRHDWKYREVLEKVSAALREDSQLPLSCLHAVEFLERIGYVHGLESCWLSLDHTLLLSSTDPVGVVMTCLTDKPPTALPTLSQMSYAIPKHVSRSVSVGVDTQIHVTIRHVSWYALGCLHGDVHGMEVRFHALSLDSSMSVGLKLDQFSIMDDNRTKSYDKDNMTWIQSSSSSSFLVCQVYLAPRGVPCHVFPSLAFEEPHSGMIEMSELEKTVLENKFGVVHNEEVSEVAQDIMDHYHRPGPCIRLLDGDSILSEGLSSGSVRSFGSSRSFGTQNNVLTTKERLEHELTAPLGLVRGVPRSRL